MHRGETRYHANIFWRHDRDGDEILVTTPLGQGVAELTRDANGARLAMADRRRWQASDWQDLAEEVFGSRLPLDDLPAWLIGHRPAAAAGWRVEYLDYQDGAADALPTLIELRRDDIEVRLKIHDWSLQR